MRILLIPLLALLLAPATLSAGQKPPEAPLPKNEVIGKAPSNYLALSRLHIPVLEDRNRQYRSFELEVWLLPKDEDNLALARSAKKDIMAELKEELSNYDWEAFEDSRKGPEIAKNIVNNAVTRVSGAKLQDVLIKSLLLR